MTQNIVPCTGFEPWSLHSAIRADLLAMSSAGWIDYTSCLSATERRTTAAKRDDFHYKSLFLVKKIKDNGTQKAVQRQRMGILLCEQNFRDAWIRNESVRAEIGQILHTDTHPHKHTTAAKLVVRISFGSLSVLSQIIVWCSEMACYNLAYHLIYAVDILVINTIMTGPDFAMTSPEDRLCHDCLFLDAISALPRLLLPECDDRIKVGLHLGVLVWFDLHSEVCRVARHTVGPSGVARGPPKTFGKCFFSNEFMLLRSLNV